MCLISVEHCVFVVVYMYLFYLLFDFWTWSSISHSQVGASLWLHGPVHLSVCSVVMWPLTSEQEQCLCSQWLVSEPENLSETFPPFSPLEVWIWCVCVCVLNLAICNVRTNPHKCCFSLCSVLKNEFRVRLGSKWVRRSQFRPRRTVIYVCMYVCIITCMYVVFKQDIKLTDSKAPRILVFTKLFSHLMTWVIIIFSSSWYFPTQINPVRTTMSHTVQTPLSNNTH